MTQTKIYIFYLFFTILLSADIYIDSSYQNNDSDGSSNKPYIDSVIINQIIGNGNSNSFFIQNIFFITTQILIKDSALQIIFCSAAGSLNPLINFSETGNFYISNSSVLFLNIIFENFSHQLTMGYLFYLEKNSSFQLQACGFSNITLSVDKKSQIIQNIDSSVSFIGIQINNMSMSSNGFLSHSSANSSINTSFYMQNCSFSYISQNLSLQTSPFFYIIKPLVSIILSDCSFYSILLVNDLFHFENSQSNITIEQVNFYNGVLKNQFLNVILAENLTIVDTNCTVSNSTNEAREIIYKLIGGCFRTENIFYREFRNVMVFDSFSDQTTYGIKIIDDLFVVQNIKSFPYVPLITIDDCLFQNNSLFMNGPDQESGGALYLTSDVNLEIYNTQFLGNIVDSNPHSLLQPTSPCIQSLTVDNTVFIEDSIFIENHSDYTSNCISFLGLRLTLSRVRLINNTDLVWKNDTSALKFGGAFLFYGVYFYVNSSFFQYNNGLIGGAICIDSSYYVNQSFLIENSDFEDNFSGNGGAIGLNENIQILTGVIRNNYFLGNWAALGGSIRIRTHSFNTSVWIINNVFEKGLADWGGALDLESSFAVYVSNNLFLDGVAKSYFGNGIGTGSVMIMSAGTDSRYSTYVGNNNTYMSGWGENKGTFAMFGGNFSDNGSLYLNNYGTNGGTMYTTELAYVVIYNCIFINQTSSFGGGAFAITDNARFLFVNCNFTNCISTQKGGAIYISEKSNVKMVNISINNSYALYGAILYLIENYQASIQIENCVFSNNSAYYTLIDSGTSIISINNTLIENNTNNLFSLVEATLVLISSKINNLICYTNLPGCILEAEQASTIQIQSSYFGNVTSSIEEGNFYFDSSTVYADSMTMNTLKTPKTGSCVVSYSCDLNFVSSSFVNYEINCISSFQSNINLNNTIFDNSENKKFQIVLDYGSVYCFSCNQVIIFNTSFIKNSNTMNGSAIYIVANIIDKLEAVIINSSIFYGNVASGDGTIYIYNQNFSILSSNFTNNLAQSGGGIFCDNDASTTMKMNISDNTFVNNTALIEGGAIKWNDEMPFFLNNLFLNNSAIYGDNIACFPIRIILNIYDKSNYSIENITFPQNDDILWPNNNENVSITNISSGNPIPYILQFQTLDVYGKIVNLDGGKLEMKFYSLISSANSTTNLITTGSNPQIMSQGNAVMDDLTFYYVPNLQVKMGVTASTITKFNSKYLNESTTEINSNSVYTMLFEVDFRECIMGEYYISSLQLCESCSTGEYSFADGMTAQGCLKCPNNADLCYGAIIDVSAGFWRYSLISESIYSCGDFKASCLGGYDSSCSTGFQGPLCSTCAWGYSKMGVNSCVACQDQALNMLSIIGMLILVLFLLTIFIIVSVKQSDKMIETQRSNTVNLGSIDKGSNIKKSSNRAFDVKKGMSVYLKILMNYLQMVSIIQSLDLQWPFYVQNYLNVYSNIGGVSTQILSFDCLLQDYNINTKSIYIQTVLTIFLPYGVFLISMFILGLIYLYKRKSQLIRFIVIVIVVSIFLQPSIIKVLFDNLTCETIENSSYLVANMLINCNDEDKKTWNSIFVYPFMAYWILIYPVTCLIYMIHNRNKLHDIEINAKLGFYINGYQDDYYYWEFIIMYRKIIFIAINLLSINSFTKVTILLLFAAFSFVLSIFCQPFNFKELNKIEEYSLSSAIITLFSGALYICDVSDDLKALTFAIIILVNIAFCISWLVSLLNVVFQAQLGRFQKYFPNFTYSLVALLLTLEKTKKTFNLCSYFKDVKKNFGKIRTTLVNTYESHESSNEGGSHSNVDKKKSTMMSTTAREIGKSSKFKTFSQSKKREIHPKVITMKEDD